MAIPSARRVVYEKKIHIAEWRRSAAKALADISETPLLEADLLLASVTGQSRASLLARDDLELDAATLARLADWLSARLAHIPLAYLTGEQEFWSLPLKVTRDTLVPRPETECLVECALGIIRQLKRPRILDLGTGSGAIALAIATERTDAEIIATDISATALSVARSNAAALGINNVRFVESDWTASLGAQEFDVVLSNPPYVESDYPGLSDNLQHEPRLALTSGADGLDDIRRIARETPGCIRHGGYLLVEHGHMQSSAVSGILRAQQFTAITLHRDLSGLPRFTQARWQPETHRKHS